MRVYGSSQSSWQWQEKKEVGKSRGWCNKERNNVNINRLVALVLYQCCN